MSTLNVSMPEAMRDYVEQQAHRGQYSASEYIRHLIRQDQMQQAKAERNLLWDYLAISAKQLDDGDFSDVTVESLMAEGDARRGEICVTYVLSREAGVNLRQIEDYTARKWGRDQRKKYLTEIFSAFEKLAQRPDIGRSRPDIPPPYLVYTVGSHLIIYRHNPEHDRVEILNVLHPAMNIEERISQLLNHVRRQ